jgi:radical SAM protein with 4Fe4S-binding SPASM domain
VTASGDSPYAVTKNADQFAPWRGRQPLLGKIDIELTERCNNDCIHCSINLPAGDAKARARELSTDQWKAVLTEAAGLGAITARFTGGEPLLRTDFEELYLFARRLGLKVMIFTNARLITPQLADLLSRVPPLEPIEVTVYGMTEQSYEAVARANGSYTQFARGVSLLLDRAVPFVVKGAVLPPNRDEMATFEKWAATVPSMDRSPDHSMFFELRGRRDSEERNSLIRSVRLSPEDGVTLIARDRAAYVAETREFCERFIGPPGDMLFTCGAGHGTCVDAYGFAQACLPLRHPDTVVDLCEGDSIRAGALREVLTEFFPSLRELRATNSEYLRRCARCFLKGFCEQCPAKSWAEHGTLDTPVEYVCEVAHAQARDLGLLREGESAWEVEEWRERIAWIK